MFHQKKGTTNVDLLVRSYPIDPLLSMLPAPPLESPAFSILTQCSNVFLFVPSTQCRSGQPPTSRPLFSSFCHHGHNNSSNSPREWKTTLLDLLCSGSWLGQLQRPTVPSASASYCSKVGKLAPLSHLHEQVQPASLLCPRPCLTPPSRATRSCQAIFGLLSSTPGILDWCFDCSETGWRS